MLSSQEQTLAFAFIGATGGAFIVLRLVAALVAFVARRAPKVHSPAARLAIGNIHRPGALTAPVVLSLGLGLTLLSTLALIEGNLRGNLSGAMVEKAPSFFFVDIQSRDVDGFRDVLARTAPQGQGGRGADAARPYPGLQWRSSRKKRSIPPEARWVLQGDRGITYATDIPANASLTEGKWWPKDYAGEPLVSFSAEEAGELRLKLGDTVTVNVLGRNITAQDRQFPQGRMAVDVDQFRHGLLAQHFQGRAACLAGVTDR